MSTYTCPKGHASGEADFCDTCGAKIDGTAASISVTAAPGASAAPPPFTSAPGVPCPHCGTPRTGSMRFCEDCGFDHTTGKVPVVDLPPVAATPAAAGWTATIAADREYFEDNAIEGVEFPAGAVARTVPLPPPQLRIGRTSSSKGSAPEIDLSDFDPGVSHNHALLTLSIDGVWLVSDLGSTNGTYLNAEQKPLTAGQSRALTDGDQVHVGGWTTITLHKPPTA